MEKTSFVSPTLCIVAGHSGGHILPAHTLATQWLQTTPNGSCIFFSTAKKLDKDIVLNSTVSMLHIPLVLDSFSFKKFWKLPSWIVQCIRSCIQSYRILTQHNVGKVITTGGYIAIPVCIAAKFLRIPIDVYELNATPGKAIRLLAYISQTIYVCFDAAQQYFNNRNCIVTTYPLQPALHMKAIAPQEARSSLNLHPTYITILVLGGSQGLLFINNVLQKWVKAANTYANIQIIHQTGNFDATDWNAFYATYKIPARVFPYYENMHQLYSACDIIICRSGAGSLFEAVHYKKMCITIPLESQAGNHQVMNALAMAKQYQENIVVLRQHILTHDISSLTQALDVAITRIRSGLF